MGSCGESFCTAGINPLQGSFFFLALEQRMNRSRGPRSTTDDFAVALGFVRVEGSHKVKASLICGHAAGNCGHLRVNVAILRL